MMTVTITCTECGSGIEIYPDSGANKVKCHICNNTEEVQFNSEHEAGVVKDCPVCQRKDFYKQKDFNRKIGVAIFVVAAILAFWTYGLSLPVAFAIDYFLFSKIGWIGICYKCDSIFRGATNLEDLSDFNHEMHDRIKYSDHDFQGKVLEH